MQDEKNVENLELEIDNNDSSNEKESNINNDSNSKKNEEVIDEQKNNSHKKKRMGLFERLSNIKVSKTTPTITKGKKNEYVHSNFKRKKEEEPDPDTFPKKKKILTWQEEELLMTEGTEFDQELADEIAELAERKD